MSSLQFNHITSIIFLWMMTVVASAQWTSPQLIPTLNNDQDIYPLCFHENELYFLRVDEPDLLHEEDWELPVNMDILISSSRDGFTSSRPFIFKDPILAGRQIHDITFDPNSDILLLSFSERGGTDVLHVDSSGVKKRFYNEELITHISSTDNNGFWIVSYRSEITQGLDLGVMQVDNGELLILPLSELNTNANEAFPFFFEGDLYFCRDSLSQFDIYIAYGNSQWMKSDKLDSAVNSFNDDHSMVFLSSQEAVFASNRKAAFKGDNLWRVSLSNSDKGTPVKARFMINGTPLKNIEVSVFSESDSKHTTLTTDDEGFVIIPGMEPEKEYKIKAKLSKPLMTSAEMFIYDEQDNISQKLSPSEDGYFHYFYLPYKESTIDYFDNPDLTSFIGIRLKGQVLDEDGAALDAGRLLFLVDEEGKAEKITYSEEEGKFEFDEVLPKAEYKIGVEGEDQFFIIMEGEEQALKTRNEATILYRRLEKEELISLALPNGDSIQFRRGEALALNHIEYGFDSADLDERAMLILDELVKLAKLNPNMKIELRSHTDSRGMEEYNKKLSDKRAKIAVQYIQSEGIPAENVFGTGLGESLLLNDCDDFTDCPEEKHAVNRRTEVILRMN